MIGLCWILLGGRAVAATVDDFLPLRFTNAPNQVLPARLWVPKETELERKYPLVIFLHGAGERGSDNRLQLEAQTSPLVFVEPQNQARWPCFMLAPQCPNGVTWAGLTAGDTWGDPDGTGDFTAQPTWPLASVMGLLAQLTNSPLYSARIDTARLFITGLSMGGFGSWEAISRWPGVFRGAIPICGGGDPNLAPTIGAVRVWAFHAEDDSVVMVRRSRQMVAALRAAGPVVRYTEYPASLGIGHGSWIPAYGDPGLLPWLFGESRTLGGDGLYTEYFGNTNLSGTVRTRRVEPAPNLDWGATAPTGVTADRFSARLIGQLEITTPGRYVFRARADDRLSVWLDGTPLIEGIDGMTNGITQSRDLAAGRHELRLEYVELIQRAWFRLEYGREGEVLEPIPMDVLFSGISQVAAPVFEPSGGTYAGPQRVTLRCETPDAVIRYSTDGTLPNAQSPRYQQPIEVSAPRFLRAWATKTGMTNSPVVGADYQVTPAILAQPEDLVVLPGQNALLSVLAAGAGLVRYQWQYEGSDLPGANSQQLGLTNLQVNQSGRYSVRITDDSASLTSAPAFLFVGVKPAFVSRPQPQSVLLGDPATLSVEVGGTPPFTFTWRRNGSLFTNQTLFSPFSVLVLPKVDAALAAAYTVQVSNRAGATLTSTAVRVSLLADFDADGLADAWEVQYGLSTNEVATAEEDLDGDGMTNRAEYLAGTDPKNSDSRLRLDAVRLLSNPTQVELGFEALPNRSYRLWERNELGSGTWRFTADFPAGSNTHRAILRLPVTDGARVYYRLATPVAAE